MIDLNMQIKAILFSFLYGIFTAIMMNVNYKCLFHRNRVFKIFFNIIFILDMSLLYFFVLQFINYGYLHIYFLLVFILGFFLSFGLMKKVIRQKAVNKKIKRVK